MAFKLKSKRLIFSELQARTNVCHCVIRLRSKLFSDVCIRRRTPLASGLHCGAGMSRTVCLAVMIVSLLTGCERQATNAPEPGWKAIGRDSVARETVFEDGPLTNIVRCWQKSGTFDCIDVRRSAPPHITVSRYQTSDLNAGLEEIRHFSCELDPAPNEWFRQVLFDTTADGQRNVKALNIVPRLGDKHPWSGRYVKERLIMSGFSPAAYMNCQRLYDFFLRGGVRRLSRADIDPRPLFEDVGSEQTVSR